MSEPSPHRLEDPADPGPYRSWLRVEVGTTPLPSESSPRPGPVTDVEDERLAALRRRVVEPVVHSLLVPGELEALSVHWGVDGDEGDVWGRLDVAGERYEQWLPWPWQSAPSDSAGPLGQGQASEALVTEVEVAAQLAHYLEDWVCETPLA
ncbi:hypothetical protein GCM10027586_14860 [Kineococcus gypseus]|uniref:hypothetical protein n=1 Tax=Kineococcus gypseus TaxID=1637102 RepID=UPI003D7D35DF